MCIVSRDHAGGNKELIKKSPGLEVYGGDKRIDELTKEVGHGYEFKVKIFFMYYKLFSLIKGSFRRGFKNQTSVSQ